VLDQSVFVTYRIGRRLQQYLLHKTFTIVQLLLYKWSTAAYS